MGGGGRKGVVKMGELQPKTKHGKFRGSRRLWRPGSTNLSFRKTKNWTTLILRGVSKKKYRMDGSIQL